MHFVFTSVSRFVKDLKGFFYFLSLCLFIQLVHHQDSFEFSAHVVLIAARGEQTPGGMICVFFKVACHKKGKSLKPCVSS